MSTDFRMTDLRTQLLLISQEQTHQAESLGEIRLALGALTERVERLEDRVATLEAAQESQFTGSIQGLDGSITVTMPPEWGKNVPLVTMVDDG